MRKRANLTDLLNNLTFRVNFQKYKTLALSQYTWKGLPDELEGRHIENLLFDYGRAVFVRGKKQGYMVLQASEGRGVNWAHDPLHWRATGYGFSEEFKKDDVVLIRNNIECLPTNDVVMHYVNIITETERTIDVNVKRCKTPFILGCDQNNELTVKRMFAQIDSNVPDIYVDKGFTIDALQVLQTGVTFMGNDLHDYKKSRENELLTFLGVNNVAIDKKERVNVEEAESNNEIISAFADLFFEARQQAAEAMSKMCGQTITVERREAKENVLVPNDRSSDKDDQNDD